MNRRRPLSPVGSACILLAVLVASCNLPASSGPGPSVWIDYPADGMSFSHGTLVVNSHSTSADAIAQVELYVNGVSVRNDLNPEPSHSLVQMSQPWVPAGPGIYTIEVMARDSDGNERRSLPVRVVITGVIPPRTAIDITPPACLEPTARFSIPTNCHEEPDLDRETVAVIPAGQSASILGRSEDGLWWLVRGAGGESCWVSASVVDACGAVSLVGVVAAPGASACAEPTADFTLNANCREGPGVAYDAVDVLLESTSAAIVGRNEDGTWWLVRRPSGGTCWVSEIALETCGDLSTVSEAYAPAPPAQDPAQQPPAQPPAQSQPAGPAGLHVASHVCAGQTYAITLNWSDAADNESGYRIYRNNGLVSTLGPGAQSYTDNPPQGGPYTYRVEAFNGQGTSSATTQGEGCLL